MLKVMRHSASPSFRTHIHAHTRDFHADSVSNTCRNFSVAHGGGTPSLRTAATSRTRM